MKPFCSIVWWPLTTEMIGIEGEGGDKGKARDKGEERERERGREERQERRERREREGGKIERLVGGGV